MEGIEVFVVRETLAIQGLIEVANPSALHGLTLELLNSLSQLPLSLPAIVSRPVEKRSSKQFTQDSLRHCHPRL